MDAAVDASEIGVIALQALSELQRSVPVCFEDVLEHTILERDADRLVARDKYDWMKLCLLIYSYTLCKDTGATQSQAIVLAHSIASGCARGIIAPNLFPMPDPSTQAGRVYHTVMCFFPAAPSKLATDADWEEWIDSM